MLQRIFAQVHSWHDLTSKLVNNSYYLEVGILETAFEYINSVLPYKGKKDMKFMPDLGTGSHGHVMLLSPAGSQ